MLDELFAAAAGAGAYLVLDKGAYLLGGHTALDREPPMLDWRTAPLAEAFFRPGPTYSIELDDGRILEGEVHERALRGGLTPDSRPRPSPVPITPTDRNALVILDPDQQRAVDLPSDTSLVVDGEAGVGKTLVALYRVAALAHRTERFRALVLVPTEGLRRLVRLIADRLGIGTLEIAVFDDWLLERARIVFPSLPKRASEGATAQVIGLKRHPAVRLVLDDFIDWKPPRGVDDDKVSRTRQRLLHLWGDAGRLQRIVDAAGLPARAIAQTMAHTRRQFETSTEKQMRHVDADRLVALDGKKLDAGTPMQDANTFDAEDLPVLLELVRRGALPGAKLPRYDHIVIDEAQLRAPMELAAVADALSDRGTVTVAGDHRQATDESAWFTDWSAARTELRRARWAEVTLAVTYRSVPAIADFARDMRIPAEQGAVWTTPCDGALAQTAQLCWHLDALITRDPWRQICVIARNPEHARRLHTELSRGVDPILVLDGDFRFEPGLLVTTANAISGLEFDAVVIPDLTPGFYPPTPELARALYVAATRARDWLWLLTPDEWSPLVLGTRP
jgi:DNA helicase-2/ATP-dependent DNA helicase PcrA